VNSTEQWSPLKGVSRDSVLSWRITCNACVKQLDADLSGSHGYHQKLGCANTKALASYSIVCLSENGIGKCCCQDICEDMLLHHFNCVGPFCQQNVQNTCTLRTSCWDLSVFLWRILTPSILQHLSIHHW
jgi:hypothetical protein